MDERDRRVDARLREALEAGAMPSELLVCGPAGTGKTYSILRALHCLAADYRDLRILVCRQTRASLTNSVLVTFEKEILAADGMESVAFGASRRTRSSYPYPSGSEIVLGGLDRPDRVLSTAWDVIYINEATETEEASWDTLLSRLRRPGRPGWLGHLIADTNPSAPGHWLKKRCDDGRTALWDTTHKANPRMWANGAWTAEGLQYREGLARLRGTRRLRLFDGLWAVGEGAWFDAFGAEHVSELAAYEPTLPVHLAVDSGVYTGAVAFQVRPASDGHPVVTCFYDYLSEGVSAYEAAGAILAGLAGRTGTRLVVKTDPAGGSRNPVGPTVMAEYARAGLKCDPWPVGPVSDGLSLVEALLGPPVRLWLHPGCKALSESLANYQRAKRAGQWTDQPEDPQHPAEDLVDALRGGLKAALPDGLAPPKPKLPTRHLNRVLY